ncbi:MAG: TVP38/TMEM64 family protein [Christensenellaceae bacterium]
MGVGLGVIVVFFIVFYFTVGKKIAFLIQNPEGFKEWLNGFGDSAKGVAIFIFLRVVQTVLKLIPGEALEIAAGCTFGVWYGLLWCSVGSIIGSLIIVFLGKRYGMKIVGLFVSPEKMQSISFLKNKKRLNVTFFLLYFIPGTPKDMFTWLVCLTDENIFLFILLTAVARIPSIVTSTWCGQELVEENYLLSFGILGGTILLGIIGGIIYKLVLNRNKKKAAANGVSGGGQTEEML